MRERGQGNAPPHLVLCLFFSAVCAWSVSSVSKTPLLFLSLSILLPDALVLKPQRRALVSYSFSSFSFSMFSICPQKSAQLPLRASPLPPTTDSSHRHLSSHFLCLAALQRPAACCCQCPQQRPSQGLARARRREAVHCAPGKATGSQLL